MSLYCDEDHITVTFGDEVYNLQVKQILHYGNDISRVFNIIDYDFNFNLIHKRGTIEYGETLKFNIEDREYSIELERSIWLKEMRKCIDWYLLNKLSSA